MVRTSEENFNLAYDIAADPRLDPRIKAILAGAAASTWLSSEPY